MNDLHRVQSHSCWALRRHRAFREEPPACHLAWRLLRSAETPCYNQAMDPHLLDTAARLSDDALISRVKQLAAREREATTTLVAYLAEFDERRLYLGEGCSSLFTYCTQVLLLSEPAAYRRIVAARAARRFPIILERLEEGAITLTTVCLLASHLTEENHRAVLDAARHQSKRQVEEFIARLDPRPPVPSMIRRLPMPRVTAPSPSSAGPSDGAETVSGAAGFFSPSQPVGASAVPGTAIPDPAATHPDSATQRSAPPAVIAPLAPERYKVQFTASAEMYEKLRRAQALLRHQIPDGDPAAIFDRALTVLLEALARQKLAATDHPRDCSSESPPPVPSHSRHIPAQVRRAVWQRDNGQCTFVSLTGRRCTEQGFLEFHHVVPFSAGGPASIDNIQLRCRAHNGFEAERVFGLRTPPGVREGRRPYVSSSKQPAAPCPLQVSAAARAGPSTRSKEARYAIVAGDYVAGTGPSEEGRAH